ncbi:MAG: 1-phosphofructokinase [Kineosporiaceae bacterium]|nr:1-phosphofructokinase [Kineosporiaceae bacterium]
MTIVTLTPNPSVDRTIAVPDLRRGEVHRATSSRIDPGGKGINVSRALTAQSAATLAVFPSGGPEGALMDALLTAAAVPRHTVPVEGTLRMNVAVVEPDGTTTKLNEPGPTLGPQDVEGLIDGVLGVLDTRTSWVVGCGSLPPGAPEDLYATLITRLREHGVRVAIDSSQAPLAAAVRARPHLIKPNHEELAELVDRPLPTLGDVRDAAADLIDKGLERVVVSLGRDGALLVDEDTCLHAVATIGDPLSTVGAGDCLLAGLLNALSVGADASTALISGVTWGAAAVRLPGSRVPAPADCQDIVVSLVEPDLARPLP